MNDNWLEITIDAAQGDLEEVCAKLTAAGMTGLVIEDEADFKTFLEDNRQYWDYVDDALMEKMRGAARVKFYVTDDEDGRAQLKGYTAGIAQPYTALPLGESDWAHSWQKYYRPMAVGVRLYIVPEWERGTTVPPGRTPLYLNPGLIFGTGSHASTQLCLEGLERYTQQNGAVLDLGCGSGILSIAALKLGAGSAVGVDIDSKAVGVAYENAALNGVGRDRYTVLAGDVLSDDALMAQLAGRRYQLVLANIVADVIISLSPRAHALLAPDGVFLCSGIIDARADEVAAALRASGLSIAEKTEKNGWISFAAKRVKGGSSTEHLCCAT
ncbi:MAG: 50S ribosomal protein L11 methyltransferase [Clostridia bacterium]|nr:50S ribosomal protein L11 methyltransferase [Clostridia bacterium]